MRTWTLLLALPLLAACRDECVADVAYGDSAHAVTLEIADAPGGATLEYGYAHDLDRTAATSQEGGALTAELNGLPALRDVYYRLMDGDREECVGAFTTQNLPPEAPRLKVTGFKADKAGSWRMLAGVAMGDSGTLFVVDRFGDLLWHYQHDPDLIATTVHLDGEEILYNTFDQDRTNDVGEVHRLTLDGEEIETIRTEGAHHVFELLPDGTIAFPAVDVQTWVDPDLGEPVSVVGDKLVEIRPDGTEEPIFSVWDYEDPAKHDHWDSGFYGEVGHDWTHANSVRYDATRGTYLFSLGHLDTIYEIDRSGAVINRFTTDWVAEGSTVYNFQHDVHWTPQGTLMMISYPGTQLAAVEYAVDEDSQTLTEVWSHVQGSSGATLLGQAMRLENGNTLLNFGGNGLMVELDPDANAVWKAETPLGSWFGNGVRMSGWFEKEED